MHIVFLVSSILLVATPSYAYLDPGTGSMMLQGLIAAFAALVTAGGLYWSKIKSFFIRNGKDVEGESRSTDESFEEQDKDDRS